MIQSYIDWTPLILDHWKELLFKQCVTINNGRDYKNIESTEGVPVIGSGGQFTYCTEEMYNGEVIFLGRKGTIDKPIYYKGPFWAVDTMFYAIPNKKFCAKYLYYLSTCFPFKGISTQTALPSMTQTALKNVVVFTPSLADQQRMVTYLDTKLSEIDHQVSLLTSKRDAYLRLKKSIINHAVTHGLDPNVKMKDSGIEWIGDVPEHWEMCRFKDAFRRWTTGITPDSKNYKYFESDICKGYTWVTISDFLEKYISQSSLNLSDESIKLFMPPLSLKGSLMFSFKLSVGKIAFADKDLYTNEAIVSIPPNNGQCLEYYYYMLPNVLHENATENIYGAKMLNQKIIANMLMVVPPLPEQRAIATYLDDKCAKIDTIVSNLDKQISRYADLKRSLIDEVITGKRAV